jgi:glucose dehydrogenase
MRKLLYFVVTAGVVAITIVALASAAGNGAGRTSAEAANAYLPAGMKPAINDWSLPGGDAAGTLFSQLKDINSNNVASLKLVWQGPLQPGNATGNGSASPICCPNGLLLQNYVLGMTAANPATGQIAWQYKGVQYNTIRTPTATVGPSRGLAYNAKADLVYMGQNDGSLVALKAKTGAPVWTAAISGVGTYGSATLSFTAPHPLYYDDGKDGIVVAAPNGGETPFRGHVDAYNAKTGSLVWRVWTTPDPTQLPFILTWANPAEASQGGGAIWSNPVVDTENRLVYFGSGNPYPWTGRQPGDNLWVDTLFAVDSDTGTLKWYFQHTKHDIWDLDAPQPPTRMNVPINGKMTPVIAQGGKNGYLYVLNALNGSYLPHFTFHKIQTYDPTGRGIKLNALSKNQVIPKFGAAGCVHIVDMTPAGLAACAAVQGNKPVAGTEKSGVGAVTTGIGAFVPADLLQIHFGGTNPNPGVPGSYGPNVRGANGADPCPSCKVVNLANGRPIEGTTFASAHTEAAYFVNGSSGIGIMNYPMKAYNPMTRNLYMCVLQGNNTGKSNTSAASSAQSSVGASTTDPRVFTSTLDAINMTNNTFAWRFGSKTSTYGGCSQGQMTTAGNLVFSAFPGRSDQTGLALFGKGITPGGVFMAFDATTGKVLWQWGSPAGTFTGHPITYKHNGKQYVAIYRTVPASNNLPGGLGSRSDGAREAMVVFSL